MTGNLFVLFVLLEAFLFTFILVKKQLRVEVIIVGVLLGLITSMYPLSVALMLLLYHYLLEIEKDFSFIKLVFAGFIAIGSLIIEAVAYLDMPTKGFYLIHLLGFGYAAYLVSFIE